MNTLNPIIAQTRQSEIVRATRSRRSAPVAALIARFRDGHRPPQGKGGIIPTWQHGSQVPGS